MKEVKSGQNAVNSVMLGMVLAMSSALAGAGPVDYGVPKPCEMCGADLCPGGTCSNSAGQKCACPTNGGATCFAC